MEAKGTKGAMFLHDPLGGRWLSHVLMAVPQRTRETVLHGVIAAVQ